MIITLKSRSGKLVKEQIQANDLTLEDAKERFDSVLFEVVGIEEEHFGNWSNERACQIIANEGADYAVRSYCNSKEFKDPVTRDLWNKAEIALDALDSHIGYEEWLEYND